MGNLSVGELLSTWRKRYALLTTAEKVFSVGLVCCLWTSQAFSFFGMNFWIHHFKQNPLAHSNFVSIWVPALLWCIFYLVPSTIYRCCVLPRGEDWSFVFSRKSLGLLCVIGLADSLGGLTSLYSAKWTPIFLQPMLGSTVPIWTFLLTKVFYKERARPFTVYPAVAFLLVAVGILTSAYRQFEHIELNHLTSRICWSLIFLVGIVIQPVYGVLQGRYVHEYKDQSSSIASTRMIVLVGDTSWQLLFTTLYFPLDAVPWFGSAPYSIDASWTGFTQALDCILQCEYNAIYMLMYVGGFYVSHIIGVVMNHYSPTLYAVVQLVSIPMNALLIVVFPVLRVSGVSGEWYLDFICLLCVILSCALFVVWEESIRYMDSMQREAALLPLVEHPSKSADVLGDLQAPPASRGPTLYG